MQDLQVEKKDGRKEPFQREKIVRSLESAGATYEDAVSIATEVVNWAESNAQDGVVKTSEIREKVIEKLEPVNPDAAEAYKTYKKPD